MKSLSLDAVKTDCAVRREQDFEVYVLNNQEVEIAVIPALGGRITSLRDGRTGREWLWHPGKERKLFRNRVEDRFENSPLAGIDECFPTIAPCVSQGRVLPDHGELWTASWSVDAPAWARGILRARVSLQVSPFEFERTVELRGNTVRLSYRVDNRSANEESYLWALHPLLRLQPGDELQLPASTRALLNGAACVDALDSVVPNGGCEKLFAGPVTEAVAAIHNPATGDRLAFEWDPAQNNTLGLWLTRGGWHGHHHFALEPTNGEPDSLSVAAQRGRCGTVAAGGSVRWQVCLRLGR